NQISHDLRLTQKLTNDSRKRGDAHYQRHVLQKIVRYNRHECPAQRYSIQQPSTSLCPCDVARLSDVQIRPAHANRSGIDHGTCRNKAEVPALASASHVLWRFAMVRKSAQRSQRKTQRKSARRGSRGRRWSARVTRQSDALDLDRGVFTKRDPKRIAASLK